MTTPVIVSAQEWEAARQRLLVQEKELTHARDALAAQRRRMPWLAVEKDYAFDGPAGRVSLLDLFQGRRQLIVYRAFFEPGVFGWPDHACRGCSMVADQVAHVAHLNARDTTLAFVSRAPQADITRVKARCGIGQRVLTQIADLVRADGAIELLTSYEPGEGEPWPFYQQFGFQPTGEIDDGEIMLRLSFSAR
jgi:predicted dithiol-disulfide oxidoreductase (DUF899 family)